MKKILILTAMLIGFTATACAPLLATAQGERATLSSDGTSVLFSNPGSSTAEDVSVTLYGPVTVTGAACTPFSKSWICPIGSVPSGKGYRLQFTGPLNNASASFYRAGSGDRPIYIQYR